MKASYFRALLNLSFNNITFYAKINTSIEFYLQRVILKERLTLAPFQNLHNLNSTQESRLGCKVRGEARVPNRTVHSVT